MPQRIRKFRFHGWLFGILGFVFQQPSSGLQVRSYVQVQHDWFFGNPGAPFLNGAFLPDSTLFRGIGQPTGDEWFRHMALISPRHFVYATHYEVSTSWQLRFMGSDGQLRSYGISGTVPVKNDADENTDLMLGTLSTAVDPSTGVLPFPVLNLANENAYAGITLQVFGKAARSSMMPLGGFTTLVNDPGFDTTRFGYFDYLPTGSPSDCNYEGGDSGCPTFTLVNGQPALLGTNSGRDYFSGTDTYRNYFNFIPAYLTQLDALMEAEGYHIKRFHPDLTTVQSSIGAVNALRKLKSGTIQISAQNNGSASAHNVTATLTFSHPPTTVSGNGWFFENIDPTTWKCRRGGINPGAAEAIQATWSELPSSSTLQAQIVHLHDGASASTTTTSLPLLETFASWSEELIDPAPDADPDHDGIPNLIEYAFGGNGGESALTSADGHRLGLAVEKAGQTLIVHYPRRTNAAVLGISYIPEFSTTATSWSGALPSGTVVLADPFGPAWEGYEEACLVIPIGEGTTLVRMRITLDEDP